MPALDTVVTKGNEKGKIYTRKDCSKSQRIGKVHTLHAGCYVVILLRFPFLFTVEFCSLLCMITHLDITSI